MEWKIFGFSFYNFFFLLLLFNVLAVVEREIYLMLLTWDTILWFEVSIEFSVCTEFNINHLSLTGNVRDFEFQPLLASILQNLRSILTSYRSST